MRGPVFSVLIFAAIVGLSSASPKRPARPEGLEEEGRDPLSTLFGNQPSNFPFTNNKNDDDLEEDAEVTESKENPAVPDPENPVAEERESRPPLPGEDANLPVVAAPAKKFEFGIFFDRDEDRDDDRNYFGNSNRNDDGFNFGNSGSSSWGSGNSGSNSWGSGNSGSNSWGTGNSGWGSDRNDDRNNNRDDDEDAEMMPYRVLESTRDYELRRYPESKWVCTQEVVDLDDDPYKDWRRRFRDGKEAEREVMRSDRNRKEGNSAMFKKLFQYIIGVNTEASEIDMTRPVTVKRMRLVRNRERQEMCFWTGQPWARRRLPKPIKDDVYLQERPEMEFFVRQVDGEYVLSQEDQEEILQDLADALRDRDDVVSTGVYYTAGYNSPFTSRRSQRHEVWIERDTSVSRSPFTQDDNNNRNNIGNRFGSSSSNNRNNNNWFENPQLPRNFESIDDSMETLDYNIIGSEREYEVRQYKPTKWICAEVNDVDLDDHPFNDWRRKYNNNPFVAMSSKEAESGTQATFLNRLFGYFFGVNAGYVEIPIARPTITRITPKSRRSKLADVQMCFWLGKRYERRTPPEPVKQGLKIVETEEMTVFVREFPGFALGPDDLDDQYQELKTDLRGKLFDPDTYYGVTYNLPQSAVNRRNEIWIPAI